MAKKTTRKKEPLVDPRLMEILCCPECKGDLVLKDLRGKDKKIDGTLTCKKCKEVYPIEDGIPIMLPKELR
jgi:uncharacterized protein YbaR (Trm112 family)